METSSTEWWISWSFHQNFFGPSAALEIRDEARGPGAPEDAASAFRVSLKMTLPELGRDAADMNDRFRVVAVHVQDRRLHDLGDLGAIRARAREGRKRGEADLVVDHEMDRAADAVAAEVAEVEALGHQALAGDPAIEGVVLGGAPDRAGDARVDRVRRARTGHRRIHSVRILPRPFAVGRARTHRRGPGRACGRNT